MAGVERPYPFEARTVQAGAFRTVMEAIKDMLTEANITCDASGIKIMAMDESHTVLVHMRLHAQNFQFYHCTRTFVLGVNMIYLFKIVKSMDNDDVLTLYLDESNINELHLKMENTKRSHSTTQTLKLIELDKTEIAIPPAPATTVITMPSTDFQKLCRDMFAIGQKMEITCVGSQITFKTAGDFAERRTVMHTAKDGMQITEQPNKNEVVQGEYNLKNLTVFCKATALSHCVQLLLKNSYPLIVEYGVADLGTLRMCLAPSVRR